jgi:SH3-like domain-containing protein
MARLSGNLANVFGTASLLLTAAVNAALAQRPSPVAPIRYVSQRADTAYLREGPSFQYRILWVYRHKGYPFAVIAQYDIWRRVKTPDGTVGWMSSQMLSDQRTVLVTGKDRAGFYSDPEPNARLIAYAMPGATARLEACALRSCRVSAPGLKGWIDKGRLWGVGPDEVFK